MARNKKKKGQLSFRFGLNDERVPKYVVEFVMYHELLHKAHGIGFATSRRTMHTPAFRADERRFHTVPFAIYRGDRNWVPPLIAQERRQWNVHHNPSLIGRIPTRRRRRWTQ